jgi:hypothetical protein
MISQIYAIKPPQGVCFSLVVQGPATAEWAVITGCSHAQHAKTLCAVQPHSGAGFGAMDLQNCASLHANVQRCRLRVGKEHDRCFAL